MQLDMHIWLISLGGRSNSEKAEERMRGGRGKGLGGEKEVVIEVVIPFMREE